MTRSAADIFNEARELPADKRDAYLLGACGKDSALRANVDALLQADAAAGGFMASPTSGSAGQAEVAPSQEQAGARIGRYKLLEQIGEGGMGTIWMAEQREPVKRRVALKIIKLGMDTKLVIARFEAERQALAMMDHPNIAKVLDAGATDTGRPYFVMEYIKGIPILEYCDQAKVDTRARLELFADVCHAIQHAHQKGIIHRDIKPDNVLVTLHDGVPVPKVIDFGIAKATHAELTQKTLFTEHRQMVGTPAYMSPEQAEMSGLDIDTRSDVYSLGVLLYEMLTGTTPFDMKQLLESGFAEMMRTIREVEPHKPSTRISSLGATASRTAEQRHVDVKKLGTLLRGDLDWIVMKCLEKDRSRRYETANGLAADIQRHLHDEPVTAGAPSTGYRLRKFVKRNRLQVLAGTAVAVALLVGIIGFAWQARVAEEQRVEAVSARTSEAEQRKLADAARVEAQTQAANAKEQEAEARKQAAEARAQEAEARKQTAIAEAIAEFQTEMLAAADPQQLLGDKVTVLQVMEAAVELLDTGSLADQPLVEAGVRNTIGNTLQGLARYEDAEPNLRKSLAIRREVLPDGHRNIGVSLNNLAVLLRVQNKLDEAELLLREALVILRAAHPAGHPNIARSLTNLADLLRDQNKPAEAAPLYREALEIKRALLPAGHPDMARDLIGIASVLVSQDKFDEAEALVREALAIRRAALPAGHPRIASASNVLGSLLQDQSKLDEAEPLLREALAIRRAWLPAEHPAIAGALNDLAELLGEQNKLDEAEPLFREALKIRRAGHPGGHPQVAYGLTNLATHLQTRNKIDEAEPLYREALAILRAARPAGHPDIAGVASGLAALLHEQNKLAEAETLLREALAIARAAYPARHRHIGRALNGLGVLLRSQNKLTEAEPLFREALAIRREALPAGHPDTANSLGNLASLLRAQNRLDEAEPLLREALAIRRAAHPAGHPDIAGDLTSLGSLLCRQNKIDEAEPLHREALAISRATLPAGHPDIARDLTSLGSLLRAQNKLTEAESPYREALDIERAARPAGHPNIAQALTSLASLLRAQNKLDEAEPLLREALAIARAGFPAGHPNIGFCLTELGSLLEDQGKLDEAEPLFREALEIHRAALPARHPDIASTLGELGVLNWRLGQLDQSIPMFEEALEAQEAALGRGHLTTLLTVANLGVNYKDAGRLAEAIPLLEEAYEASKHDPSMAWVGTQLVSAYARAADPQEPESVARVVAMMQTVLVGRRARLAKDRVGLAGQLATFSRTLLELKAWADAEPWIREALAIREEIQPDTWTTFNSTSQLGAALLGLEQLSEAEPLLLAGYRGMKEREASIPAGVRVLRIRQALERLVQLYEAQGNASEAEAWRSRLESARAATPTTDRGK